MRHGFVRINGLGVAYLEAGAGPLVVVLHGFPDTAHSFEDLLDRLGRAGFHAVAPFLRGYPPTELPTDRDYTLRALAGDLIGLVDALGAPKAVVVGHDWGSVIAQIAVKLEPDRFDRVVLAGFPHLRSFLTITPRQLRRSIYMAQFQLPSWPERRLPRDDFSWITRPGPPLVPELGIRPRRADCDQGLAQPSRPPRSGTGLLPGRPWPTRPTIRVPPRRRADSGSGASHLRHRRRVHRCRNLSPPDRHVRHRFRPPRDHRCRAFHPPRTAGMVRRTGHRVPVPDFLTGPIERTRTMPNHRAQSAGPQPAPISVPQSRRRCTQRVTDATE